MRRLVRALGVLGEVVEIKFFHLRRYPADSDDIAFVLCALNGRATHLVTYDNHLFEVAHEYPFIVCNPFQFLAELRVPQGYAPGAPPSPPTPLDTDGDGPPDAEELLAPSTHSAALRAPGPIGQMN